jgi:transglutaminase-like putative cysteine protease
MSLLLATAALASPTIPTWVHEAARQPAGAGYPPKVTSEVLLSEEHLTVAPDGRRAMTERGVIRILEASKHAPVAYRAYNTKSGRIRDFRAWLILPSGKETEYDKKRIVDVALDSHDTYDEGRAKAIECDSTAPPGSIFAYEVTEEEDSLLTTYEYAFQGSSPTAVSRFVLSVPAAWEARGTLLNHADLAPTVAGSTYTWELRDLPAREDEELAPTLDAIVPRLGITCYPSSAANASLAPLKDWPAVSAWLGGFVEPAAALSPAISAKAADLTRGASSDMDKIRRLAEFVQKTNYVSVNMNLTHGGGYTPHLADDVLSRNYGDCKDKATLLRALLRAAGISSHAVVIYSGDRDYVRPEWPSPMQFNHAIVAIGIPRGVEAQAVIDHPRLGRLLIFDPTDPYTPVGDLDTDEQGSYALVIAGPDGDLLRMPRLPAASSRIELAVDGEVSADGKAQAHLVSQYFGQSAAYWRAVQRQGGADELRKALERVFTHRLGGVTLDKIAAAEQTGKLDLAVDLNIRQFGQSMQDKLLIVKPGALAPDHGYNLPRNERRLPIKLSSFSRKDQVVLRLPAGYAVDELPEPVDLKSPYGVYSATWKVTGDRVTFDQTLEINDLTAPAADYARVRDFFDRVSGGQFAPVVLVKH